MSNPYNAKIIPKNDVYGDVPLYGRFESTVDDFDPTNKTPQEILQLCGPANEMLPEVPVRRMYALGKVIIKGADFGGEAFNLTNTETRMRLRRSPLSLNIFLRSPCQR
jgi:hypothetical protein